MVRTIGDAIRITRLSLHEPRRDRLLGFAQEGATARLARLDHVGGVCDLRDRRARATLFVLFTHSPLLGNRAGGRQLAELGELEGDGALEVVLMQRGLFLRREERRAQAGVADVAAGQLVLAGEHVEGELAGARQLARQVGAPQLGAGVLVGNGNDSRNDSRRLNAGSIEPPLLVVRIAMPSNASSRCRR